MRHSRQFALELRKKPIFSPILLALVVLGAVAICSRMPNLEAAPTPPGYYERLKAEAAEVLYIRVTAVRPVLADGQAPYRFEVIAHVLSVSRSRSGLKPGDSVHFNLRMWPSGRIPPGVSPEPLLLPRWKGRVYLDASTALPAAESSQEGNPIRELAAAGESFEPAGRKGRRLTIYTPTQEQIERSRR